MLRTVAGVLHLGNVSFANNGSDEAVVADEASMTALEAAARQLGVSCRDGCGFAEGSLA